MRGRTTRRKSVRAASHTARYAALSAREQRVAKKLLRTEIVLSFARARFYLTEFEDREMARMEDVIMDSLTRL